MEMKSRQESQFSTPKKVVTHFVNREEAFRTPVSAFGMRNESVMNSPFTATPSHFREHDPDAPNFYVCSTEELPTMRPDITIDQVVAKIREAYAVKGNKNWEAKFEAITALRVINKAFPDDIFEVFMHFGDEIIASLGLKSPVIHRSIIVFIYEVYTATRNKYLDDRITERLIPILCGRANSSSKSIRGLAKACLEIIISKHVSNSSLYKFAETALCKDYRTAEKGMSMLGLSMGTLGQRITEINELTLQAIFVAFAKNLVGKGARMVKWAKEGTEFMLKLMGEQNFLRLISQLHDNQHISTDEGNYIVEIIRCCGGVDPKVRRDIERKNFKRDCRLSKRQNGNNPDVPIDVKADHLTQKREQTGESYNYEGSENARAGGFFGSKDYFDRG